MSNDYKIRIKGKLELISTEIIQEEVVIGSKVFAKDEDGVIWNVSGRNFPFDISFHALPDIYKGSYRVETSYRDYIVQAESNEDAIAKTLKANSWMKKESLKIKDVLHPMIEADEVMEYDEFRKLIWSTEARASKAKKKEG